LSTKLSEYLASGRLVISSGVGDVPRYVTNGESALLVEPTFTTEEVAAALSRAIRDPALRRRIGQGGSEVARTHFDVPVISHRLGDLLAGLGGGA
jgi:glycosyltransferase involved in cell wall biosynthesis